MFWNNRQRRESRRKGEVGARGLCAASEALKRRGTVMQAYERQDGELERLEGGFNNRERWSRISCKSWRA